MIIEDANVILRRIRDEYAERLATVADGVGTGKHSHAPVAGERYRLTQRILALDTAAVIIAESLRR